jgi:hypothetical protein
VKIQLIIDNDVEKIIEFMMREIGVVKLCGVAHAVAQIGDLIWAQYSDQPIQPIIIERRSECSTLTTKSLHESQQPLDAT